jgi:squalene-hopene/tetraprenyl-beta-curcumene cyclase
MLGMQCKNGGWASFDKDNDRYLYTQVPFADHNAMIDPPTSDITGRVLECLGEFGYTPDMPEARRAIEFIRKDQCEDGSWFGRWGCNYIYGTWQVLVGLAQLGEDLNQTYVQRAVRWMKSVQNEDGGWGEALGSYNNDTLKGKGPSTASQTAWGVLSLIAAGESRSRAVRRGIEWLMTHQNQDGSFSEKEWTGTGFPKVFYLRYHYYRQYFPLLAFNAYVAAFREERADNTVPFEPSPYEPREPKVLRVAE